MLSGHVHLGKKESQSEISDFYILCLKESQSVMQRAREKRRGGGEGRGGEGREGEGRGKHADLFRFNSFYETYKNP